MDSSEAQHCAEANQPLNLETLLRATWGLVYKVNRCSPIQIQGLQSYANTLGGAGTLAKLQCRGSATQEVPDPRNICCLYLRMDTAAPGVS